MGDASAPPIAHLRWTIVTVVYNEGTNRRLGVSSPKNRTLRNSRPNVICPLGFEDVLYFFVLYRTCTYIQGGDLSRRMTLWVHA
jgi:hypothetical protein